MLTMIRVYKDLLYLFLPSLGNINYPRIKNSFINHFAIDTSYKLNANCFIISNVKLVMLKKRERLLKDEQRHPETFWNSLFPSLHSVKKLEILRNRA